MYKGQRQQCGFLIILLTSLFLQPIYSERYGKAYVTQVINNTPFDVTVQFADSQDSKRTIPPSLSLGKPIETISNNSAANDVANMAADMLPVSRLGMMRELQDPNNLGGKIKDTNLERQFLVNGFGRTQLNGFAENQILFLQALNGSGGAWLSKQGINLAIPVGVDARKMAITNEESYRLPRTIVFQASSESDGQAIVQMRNLNDDKPCLRLILGQDHNQRCDLEINGKIVATAFTNDWPLSRLLDNNYQSFWLSVDKQGSILVGQGVPGQNPFLVYRDVTLVGKVNQVGFSSNKKAVSFQQMAIQPEVIYAVPPEAPLWQANQMTIDKPVVLPSPGQGSFFWHMAAKENDWQIQLVTSQNETAYILQVVGNNLTLRQDGAATVLASATLCNVGHVADWWLGLVDSTLVVGSGGKQTVGLVPLALITHPSLGLITGLKVVVNNSAWKNPALYSVLRPRVNVPLSGQLDSTYHFAGNITVIREFNYKFWQEEQAINGTDLIGGQTWVLGKAPQWEAVYAFSITLDSSGLPNLKWAIPPVNPVRMVLKVGAAALSVTSGLLYMVADNIGQGPQDLPIPAQLSLTADNIQTAMLAMTAQLAAGALAATDSLFASNQSYVVQEKANVGTSLVGNNLQSEKMMALIQAKLSITTGLDLTDRNNYELMLSQYSEILPLIVLPLPKGDVKKRYLEGIKLLLDYYNSAKLQTVQSNYKMQALSATYKALSQRFIRFLLDLLEHPYVVELGNDVDQQAKNFWKAKFKEVASDLFTGLAAAAIPANENYLFDCKRVIDDKQGMCFFELQGTGPISLVLGQKPGITLDECQKYYKLDWTNINGQATLSVRNQSAGAPLVSVDLNKSYNAATWTAFWVNWQADTLTVGQGDPGQNIILTWKDPYPLSAPLNVLIATHYVASSVRHISTLPGLSRLSTNDVTSWRKTLTDFDAAMLAASSKPDENTAKQQNVLQMQLDQFQNGALSNTLDWQAYLNTTSSLDRSVFTKNPLDKNALEQETMYQTGGVEMTVNAAVQAVNAQKAASSKINVQAPKAATQQEHILTGAALKSVGNLSQSVQQADQEWQQLKEGKANAKLLKRSIRSADARSQLSAKLQEGVDEALGYQISVKEDEFGNTIKTKTSLKTQLKNDLAGIKDVNQMAKDKLSEVTARFKKKTTAYAPSVADLASDVAAQGEQMQGGDVALAGGQASHLAQQKKKLQMQAATQKALAEAKANRRSIKKREKAFMIGAGILPALQAPDTQALIPETVEDQVTAPSTGVAPAMQGSAQPKMVDNDAAAVENDDVGDGVDDSNNAT